MSASVPMPARGVHDSLAQLVARDHRAKPGALDLAARGLGDGARRDEEDTGGAVPPAAVHALDDLAHEMAQALRVLGAFANLRDHVETLAACPLALDGHGGGGGVAGAGVDDSFRVR